MSRTRFKARVWLVDGCIHHKEVWCDGLAPMGTGACEPADWIHEHLSLCDVDELRELLGVPEEGDYQVVFEGEIVSWMDMWGECDEEITVPDRSTIQMALIPDDHFITVYELLTQAGDYGDSRTTDDTHDGA